MNANAIRENRMNVAFSIRERRASEGAESMWDLLRVCARGTTYISRNKIFLMHPVNSARVPEQYGPRRMRSPD